MSEQVSVDVSEAQEGDAERQGSEFIFNGVRLWVFFLS